MFNEAKNHSLYDEVNGIILGSLTVGTDLMEGIMQEYRKYDVKSGVVTCIGSLSRATYVYAKADQNGKVAYSDPIIEEGPIEILNGTGFLCRNEKGQTDIHLHAIFCNEKGKVFGGHILPGKNPTLVTVEFSIQVGKNIEALRTFKPQLGFQTITFNRGKGDKFLINPFSF